MRRPSTLGVVVTMMSGTKMLLSSAGTGSYSTLVGWRTDVIRPLASLLAAALALAVASVGAEQAATRKALMNPAGLKAQAPAAYKVKFDTSVGEFVIQVTRDWAPNGADRFFNLVKNGFYDEARFFRAIPNFMVQFGIHADP